MTNPQLATLDAKIFARMLAKGLGDEAVFYSAGEGKGVPCTVIVSRASQYQNQDSGVVSAAVTIMAKRAEIGRADPPSKSFFTVGRETFVVDRVDELSDESRVVLIVTPRSC